MYTTVVELNAEEKDCLIPLFSKLHDSLITSCIQNYFGRAWVDHKENPSSGKIVVADFAFLAGKPNRDVLVSGMEDIGENDQILIADDAQWYDLIEKEFAGKFHRTERYAIKKEGDIFDRKKLQGFVDKIKGSYSIRLIQKEDVSFLLQEGWSRDFCGNFQNADDFCKRGLGVIICDDKEIVAGASSYTSYREGIEIEIVTREDYRKRGLAHAAGAKLILECLQRNLYPNWDAQNMTSVHVAVDLGYHYDAPYTVYEVRQ